jgi:hypothetical protein
MWVGKVSVAGLWANLWGPRHLLHPLLLQLLFHARQRVRMLLFEHRLVRFSASLAHLHRQL